MENGEGFEEAVRRNPGQTPAPQRLDTGGPAFPNVYTRDGKPLPGMSMRDWFAGQALVGLLLDFKRMGQTLTDEEHFAEAAYQQADAMLKARIQ